MFHESLSTVEGVKELYVTYVYCNDFGLYDFNLLHMHLYILQLIERPFTLIEEDPQSRRGSPVARVEKMFEQIKEKLPGPPEFILCVLAERKNSDIYGMALQYFNLLKGQCSY